MWLLVSWIARSKLGRSEKWRIRVGDYIGCTIRRSISPSQLKTFPQSDSYNTSDPQEHVEVISYIGQTYVLTCVVLLEM